MEKNYNINLVKHEEFMGKAISIAKHALKIGEFPVGCVIEYNNNVIASGVRSNSNGVHRNELDHAEINALRNLSSLDIKYDSSKITLYSTLEPCLMCFGAILLSGITKIVFAYEDVMGGAICCDLSKLSFLYSNPIVNIVPGVLRNESLNLFKLFFMNSKNIYWLKSKLSCYTIQQDNG